MTNSAVATRISLAVRHSAAAVHTAVATLNMTTQVRRRRARSTAGAHNTYQMAGACTMAAMLAMRSTGAPYFLSRYGNATAVTPLKLPYGIAITAKSHRGGPRRVLLLNSAACDAPTSVTGRRVAVRCTRAGQASDRRR